MTLRVELSLKPHCCPFCDVAVGNVEVANSKTKVSDCAKKMKTLNIEQIPVIGVEGDLVGLVRASDLIKALVE